MAVALLILTVGFLILAIHFFWYSQQKYRIKQPETGEDEKHE